MDKVRFLMSDTSADVTAACREALEQKGVEVTVVEKDGLQVLQKMLVVRPQVVLLDAFMPGLDALAVKQKYVAAGETHTTFFVTGAFQSEEMVQELLDEGFAYYFVKPFDENVLASRVLMWASYRAVNCASVAASCAGVRASAGENRSTSLGMPLPTIILNCATVKVGQPFWAHTQLPASARSSMVFSRVPSRSNNTVFIIK